MAERILVVDDDKNIRYSLKRMFEEKKLEVMEAKNGQEAVAYIQDRDVDLVLMDVRMPGITGLEVLKEIRKSNPKLLIIMMTAYGTTETAIEAMKFGAFDYILKPFNIPYLWNLVQKALQVNRLMKRTVAYATEKCEIDVGECIVGSSLKMQEVYKLIGKIAGQDVTVLLRGESGTGKELVARAIYHHSRRNDKGFLPVNCAAIPETLLESELFGHERGAFTDAQSRRIGKFEQCDGGTIFLDEIGDMSLVTQAKILRVLQEKKITRLGSNEPIPVDVRLIIATNKNLEVAMKNGMFREDLYYRLNVVTITLPPLRERKGDISELAQYFLKRFNRELEKDIIAINPETMEKLLSYNWPGNVRELENAIKRACILCKGAYILPEELLLDVQKEEVITKEQDFDELMDALYEKIFEISRDKKEDAMSVVERALIIRTLKATKGNQLHAAEILGINRNTLRNKIEKYAIKMNKAIEI
jgi:nitrogen regulation protein NR(I)